MKLCNLRLDKIIMKKENPLGVSLGVSPKMNHDIYIINQMNMIQVLFLLSHHFKRFPGRQKSTKAHILRFIARSYLLLSTGLNRNQVTAGGISGGILCSVQEDAPDQASYATGLLYPEINTPLMAVWRRNPQNRCWFILIKVVIHKL